MGGKAFQILSLKLMETSCPERAGVLVNGATLEYFTSNLVFSMRY